MQLRTPEVQQAVMSALHNDPDFAHLANGPRNVRPQLSASCTHSLRRNETLFGHPVHSCQKRAEHYPPRPSDVLKDFY